MILAQSSSKTGRPGLVPSTKTSAPNYKKIKILFCWMPHARWCVCVCVCVLDYDKVR